MARSNAARTEEPTEGKFTNKPTVLADNGHGTKVKLWNNKGENGDYQTVSVERSFKREGSDQWETQKVSLVYPTRPDSDMTISSRFPASHRAVAGGTPPQSQISPACRHSSRSKFASCAVAQSRLLDVRRSGAGSRP